MVDRAVLAHPLFTGISMVHLASLVEELARPWAAAAEGRRGRVRGGVRRRAPGAGAQYRLVFVNRLVVTLIHLRHDLPHAVLGVLFGVDRSTVTRPSVRCADCRRSGASLFLTVLACDFER
jgi:hypothetical protein